MGFYVDNKIIRYNIICEKETIDFKLSNFGIDWVFIDFGFSSLTINDKYIKSNEYTDTKLIFNKSRDITLLFYSLLKYNKLPYKIVNFLKENLMNVIINKKQYEFLPEKMNYPIENIYELTYADDFENKACEPIMILKNIEKFCKLEF